MKRATTLVILTVLIAGITAIGAYAFQNGIGRFDSYSSTSAAMAENGLTPVDEATYQNRAQEREQHREAQATRRAEQAAKREAVHAAIESDDYEAWKLAIADMPRSAELLSKVNSENFATFVSMHTARMTGDLETASALATELGISVGGKGQRGSSSGASANGRGPRNGMGGNAGHCLMN